MDTVGAYDAKTHLPKLLGRVARGENITITKHGVPVAVLQPYDAQKKIDVNKIIATLKTFRKKHRVSGFSIREMIEEGRR